MRPRLIASRPARGALDRRSEVSLALLPQISATRSIIGAAIRPLNLTEQADLSRQRSEAGHAWRLILRCMVNSDGLAVFYVGSPPNLLIVICRCQDCGSSASPSRSVDARPRSARARGRTSVGAFDGTATSTRRRRW